MSTLRRRCWFYAGIAVLSVGGLLLLVGTQTAVSDNTNNIPHASPDDKKLPTSTQEGVYRHGTAWKCKQTRLTDCKLNDGGSPKWYRQADKLVVFDCPGGGNRDCGHSASNRFGTYAARWEYVGHRDKYETTWDGCSTTGWKNPPSQERWGQLADRTNPGKPLDNHKHCVRIPTLTVSDASALEEGQPGQAVLVGLQQGGAPADDFLLTVCQSQPSSPATADTAHPFGPPSPPRN